MEETGSTQTESRKKGGSFFFKLISYLIVFAIGVYGGTFLVKQKPTWFGLPQGTAQAQAEVNTIIAKVNKLMVLPDETPTVATVTDVNAVKDQPFFAQAQNGDRVLIYQKASEAILYRESENKIIKIGAINFNQATASATPEVQTTSTPKAKLTPTPAATIQVSPSSSPETP